MKTLIAIDVFAFELKLHLYSQKSTLKKIQLYFIRNDA